MPLIAASTGLLLSRPSDWRRMIKYLFGISCQIPLIIYFHDAISYGHLLPFEKLILLSVECQIVMLAIFQRNNSIRIMNMILAGIVGMIGYSSIQEMTLSVDISIAILIILIPVWLVIEHSIDHPVLHGIQIQENSYLLISRRKTVSALLRITSCFLLSVLILWFVGNENHVQTVLGQLVGSSGGNGDLNELATSGIGDGPNEVSASENPESTGFTDSEIYLETDRSSLFDAFNEQYGEPFKKQKFERMQAMGMQDVRENGERPKENLQAGRTFELTRRQNEKSHSKLKDRVADALIYVQGEPGKRLKVVTYDRFDGESWQKEHDCKDHCSLIVEQKPNGKCWFCIHRPVTNVFSGNVEHKIKIANFETSVLPSPNHLWKFVVGGIRQSEMFGWAGLHTIRILDRSFPAGTTVETVSNRISRRALHELHFHSDQGPTPHHKHFATKIQKIDSHAIRTLLDEWNLSGERSWMQVETLIQKLRTHATVTSQYEIPTELSENSKGAIEDFLFQSRKGPDYLFASAAVVLLRELGYPCRLAGGFYIDPASYSEKKAHYALTSANLHFWVELLLPTNHWVVVDPTPGFESETYVENYADMVWIWFYYGRAWLFFHRLKLLTLLFVIISAIFFRYQIYDQLFCFYLNYLLPVHPRRKVILTMRHLEWRMATLGVERASGCTIRNFWLKKLALNESLSAMVLLGEWAAYSDNEIQPHCPVDEIPHHCAKTLRLMNMKYFSQIQLRNR